MRLAVSEERVAVLMLLLPLSRLLLPFDAHNDGSDNVPCGQRLVVSEMMRRANGEQDDARCKQKLSGCCKACGHGVCDVEWTCRVA